MLLEYSYEKANKVLTMFNEGKLATLEIHNVSPSDDDKKFVMDYTLVSEYPTSQQMRIKKAMSNPESFTVRMRITEILNKFIENQITNTVVRFNLSFTAVETLICRSNVQSQFSGNSSVVTDKEIQSCIDKFDNIITKMGIGSTKLDNVYRKEGSGRNKKNIPVTLSDLSDMLRHILMEE